MNLLRFRTIGLHSTAYVSCALATASGALGLSYVLPSDTSVEVSVAAAVMGGAVALGLSTLSVACVMSYLEGKGYTEKELRTGSSRLETSRDLTDLL